MAELKGKVIAVLPLASGISNRTGKEWASQEYVIEENDVRYPQRTCFKVFGSDKIQQFALQLGDIVTVKLELGAREHNGKWYNEINCWSVERGQTTRPIPQPQRLLQNMQHSPQQGGYQPAQPVQQPFPPQVDTYSETLPF
ncbi:MAG: DUF3127 domain-containing protein [Prevotella sp.]|nr:DUF3127 domain-containing protein [Prevotella sp.]MDE6151349.1 DUF3127 domain-containing protein [Prevotella sp.]